LGSRMALTATPVIWIAGVPGWAGGWPVMLRGR
jgi:hypothetical protein